MRLDVDSEVVSSCLSLLDIGERRRAEAIAHAGRRHAFVITRARLRQVLGQAVDCPPAELRIVDGPGGKPALADHQNLHFSVAHADAAAMIATCRLGPVGIDIERVRPVPEMADIAVTLFGPDERAALAAATEPDRLLLFLHLWTTTEARLKATGTGFGERAVAARDAWTVTDLEAPDGYVAALARPRRAGSVIMHDVSSPVR